MTPFLVEQAIEPRSRADAGRLDEVLRRLVADEALTRDKQGCGEGWKRRETTMRWRSLVAILVLASVLAACAHQPPPTGGAPLPGLLLGLVHGYISLFSLIASLFFPVRIYEFPNNSFFYDLGFIVGVFTFYGSGRTTYVYTSSRWR